jgi:endonuclease III
MKKEDKIKLITSYFDEILPHAHCELNYEYDYQLVIAVMLSAQCTDKSVNNVTKELFAKYPSLESLANAQYEDVYNIIKRLGLATSKTNNVIGISKGLLNDFNGVVINDIEKLMTLPGVGRKTASVVTGELFNNEVIPVDTHVGRIAKRLGLASDNDDPYTIELKLEKLIKGERRMLFHHQMIHFGRYYCSSKKPNCENCKLKEICKYYKKNI